MMKTSKLFFGAFLMMSALLGFTSCEDDNESTTYGSGIVTLKPNTDNSSWFLQLNDSTKLVPSNIKQSPFGTKELRAYVVYSDPVRLNSTAGREYQVNIMSIDTILTKPLAENLITADTELAEEDSANFKAYGTDPVEIIDSWETVAEDGYLTLRFRTTFAGIKPHRVNLVHRNDLADPYVLEFFHDAMGEEGGQLTDGLAAFRLSDFFNMGDEPITITLKWSSFSGEKTKTFKYSPRKD